MANSFSVIDADATSSKPSIPGTIWKRRRKSIARGFLHAAEDETRQYWVIDDKIRGFRFPEHFPEQQLRDFSDRAGRNIATPQAGAAITLQRSRSCCQLRSRRSQHRRCD